MLEVVMVLSLNCYFPKEQQLYVVVEHVGKSLFKTFHDDFYSAKAKHDKAISTAHCKHIFNKEYILIL